MVDHIVEEAVAYIAVGDIEEPYSFVTSASA
jgi:hypothetical protein